MSTGFSPFELLYGRKVRGSLDVIKEAWEVGEGSSESVVSYLIAMREKLEGMVDLVRKNEERAKERQKEWYDRHARERELKMGAKVLVLLPTSTSKLLTKCKGHMWMTW